MRQRLTMVHILDADSADFVARQREVVEIPDIGKSAKGLVGHRCMIQDERGNLFAGQGSKPLVGQRTSRQDDPASVRVVAKQPKNRVAHTSLTDNQRMHLSSA